MATATIDDGPRILNRPRIAGLRCSRDKEVARASGHSAALEPILPEHLLERLIREDFAPALQSQTPGGAIVYGTRKIADIVRAKTVAPPPPAPPTIKSQLLAIDAFVWFMLVLAALFVGGAGFELGVGIGARAIYPSSRVSRSPRPF